MADGGPASKPAVLIVGGLGEFLIPRIQWLSLPGSWILDLVSPTAC